MRIYFSESDGDYWLKRFLKTGFSHCFIVHQGVIINPCFHCIQVFPAEPEYQCTTYLDIEIKDPPEIKRTIWQVFTCVSVVKALIGINKYAIFTPYQLFQHLERYHGIKKSA